MMKQEVRYNVDNSFRIDDFSESSKLIDETLNFIGLSVYNVENMPFSPHDVTLGSETELQTVVIGKSIDVDLPKQITGSDYYKNLIKKTLRNDVSPKMLKGLRAYLNENDENVWENSYVVFKQKNLNKYSQKILFNDLKKNKTDFNSGFRDDVNNYIRKQNGIDYIRIPVSYLIKLAVADFIGETLSEECGLRNKFSKVLDHFLSDNTSPETFSFHVCTSDGYSSPGDSVASETVIRFMFCYFAVQYANIKFGLIEEGQKADIFFSPHVPIRQKVLNKYIPDTFYREIFMNPCLSGWDEGEKKKDYMALCHMTLSRSSLHTLSKLKEAGMLFNNLVELPDVSNVSLGNNGIHVSAGSKKMTSEFKINDHFSDKHEKAFGDLVIKITEHFIPLFPGFYSSAPLRMSFKDFRMEKALGFLPHELDFFHLRILWRRWKKKSKNKLFGKIITPLGFDEVDSFFEKIFGFKGDFIFDHRLIDYPAALLSSDLCSPIDGNYDSEEKYKRYLHSCGVFDKNMSIYLLNKLRRCSSIGFCGYESRFYSLFESFSDDMSAAVNLQVLLQMLAIKYISKYNIRHEDISSDPFTESERRNAFFSTAINLPVLNFKIENGSIIQKRILNNVSKLKKSKRYKGYYKVNLVEYMKALITTIENDAADLISLYGFESVVADLKRRINNPEKYSSFSKITKSILLMNSKKKISSDDFNKKAESFYRNELKKKHLKEGISCHLEEIIKKGSFIKTSKELLDYLSILGVESGDLNKDMDNLLKSIDKDSFDLEDIKKILGTVLVSEFVEAI